MLSLQSMLTAIAMGTIKAFKMSGHVSRLINLTSADIHSSKSQQHTLKQTQIFNNYHGVKYAGLHTIRSAPLHPKHYTK